MTLRPWREIARPHKDVLEGAFKQSEFAADISQAASGAAPAEYQDAEMFFHRTFITEGMRLLLISVARRLTGAGGDPVIQLQTAFGGGKTHTMLAVMHLAQRKTSTDRLRGIPPILDEAGVHDLPAARVAVLDGIKLSPSNPQKHGPIEAKTLWGELAWQLSGEEGYAMVEKSDADGTSPGKGILVKLIEKASPCVILIDELLAFVRQLAAGQSFAAGTYDSNLSFIQALTEGMKSVPNAILLASLPESDPEIGGSMGQKTLISLEKYFGRLETVWKPVASEEAFEIVRRRLFDHAGDPSEVEPVCRAFCDFYRSNGDKFPPETQSADYFERLCQSYPIHPEIFDRLYEDWSTLDKFQRTRGVLQYMAVVIHRLWNSDNRDLLIMPGSIALDDGNVRNKSIHYLPQGWEPVIEKEVDGPRSGPSRIDGHDTRFGGVQAARRAMRTIFLGSAATASNQAVKGISLDRILLGCAQPGQTVGVFIDVLKRLRDKLQYLYSDDTRFWLDTKPNLRREMESRKLRVDFREHVFPLLKKRVEKMFGRKHCFSGIHVFTPSVDVPDDSGKGPRLVVLPPDIACACGRDDKKNAAEEAEKILKKRGDKDREKRNRLLFVAPDIDALGRLKDCARTYVAWKEILDDIDEGKLNLDLFQVKQAKKQKDAADRNLKQTARETYKWVMSPHEGPERAGQKLEWETAAVSTSSKNLSAVIEALFKDEEWLVSEWSPVHLKALLDKWYFKDGVVEIGAKKVWQDICNYLYMPRLLNEDVFKTTVEEGVASEDFFGYASGKDSDRYLGFAFGADCRAGLDESSLLVEREASLAYKEKIEVERSGTNHGDDKTGVDKKTPGGTGGNGGGGKEKDEDDSEEEKIDETTAIKKSFYGTVDIDPISATTAFSDIVDEVVENFTSKTNVKVTISVEVRAECEDGFDESLQRTIKENCNTLEFKNVEFEEGEIE